MRRCKLVHPSLLLNRPCHPVSCLVLQLPHPVLLLAYEVLRRLLWLRVLIRLLRTDHGRLCSPQNSTLYNGAQMWRSRAVVTVGPPNCVHELLIVLDTRSPYPESDLAVLPAGFTQPCQKEKFVIIRRSPPVINRQNFGEDVVVSLMGSL
jgi:hypothetical protein